MSQATERTSRKRLVETIGVAIALVGVIWAIIAWAVPPPRIAPFNVFIKDEKGSPRTDVILVGPDGDKRLPDTSGMVAVPSEWDETIVSVREQGSWTEVQTVKIARSRGGTTTITISR